MSLHVLNWRYHFYTPSSYVLKCSIVTNPSFVSGFIWCLHLTSLSGCTVLLASPSCSPLGTCPAYAMHRKFTFNIRYIMTIWCITMCDLVISIVQCTVGRNNLWRPVSKVIHKIVVTVRDIVLYSYCIRIVLYSWAIIFDTLSLVRVTSVKGYSQDCCDCTWHFHLLAPPHHPRLVSGSWKKWFIIISMF